MDAPTKRIIALVDMDCFYCQVEARLNPELIGKPVVVVQYNQWKQGGIVAVSYEARAKGVTRFMRGEEALKICPEVIIASIPCVRGKADLTKYRDAGAEVAAVFTSFSDCVQRASVDEAFIDLTEAVDKRISSRSVDLMPENLPSTYVIGYCDLKSINEEKRRKGCMSWLQRLRKGADERCADYRLAVGALIVEEMRREVLKKTGFHCSAGIAHNKILAKLAAGLHKPKCQTVSPHENVPELYETLPIHKIRTLGGKLGRIVAEKLSISYMSELYKFSKEELQSIFDAKQGAWLYDIARGINNEPVSQRLIPDSIGCCKNFKGKMSLKTPDEVMRWLREMAEEVAERLNKDLADNKRRARNLTVTFKAEKSSSRVCALTSYDPSKIASDAFEVLKKFNKSPQNSLQWDPPLEHLGLSASKFMTGQANTLSEIFKIGEAVQATAEKILESEDTVKHDCVSNSNDGEEGKLSNFEQPANVTKKRKTSDMTEQSSTITKFFKTLQSEKCGDEMNNLTLNGVSGNVGELAIDNSGNGGDGRSSFFAKFLTINKPSGDQTVSESKEDVELCNSDLPTPSASSCQLAVPGPSLLNVDQLVNDQAPQDGEFFETCPECGQKFHLELFLDHLDYHAAMKLDRELNGKVSVRSVQTARISPKKKGLLGKKQKKASNNLPPNQHSIKSFFATAPKS